VLRGVRPRPGAGLILSAVLDEAGRQLVISSLHPATGVRDGSPRDQPYLVATWRGRPAHRYGRVVTTVTDTSGSDLTMAFILIFVMIAVSFIAGYGVAYMRLSKRRRGE
jgi:hypothetical protein